MLEITGEEKVRIGGEQRRKMKRKMEAVHFPETLVCMYQTARQYIPQDSNIYRHLREVVKCHSSRLTS